MENTKRYEALVGARSYYLQVALYSFLSWVGIVAVLAILSYGDVSERLKGFLNIGIICITSMGAVFVTRSLYDAYQYHKQIKKEFK